MKLLHTMLVQLVFAIALVSLFHVCAMAACARVFGIGVRRVAWGIGPALFKLGRLRISLLPLGGHVSLTTLAEARADTPDDSILELQTRWKRVLLPLSGPLALLVLGTGVLGAAALHHFSAAFAQILGGAAGPFSDAQTLLQEAGAWLARHGLVAIIGIVACKMAALNLIPYLGSNGLHALFGLFPPHAAETTWGPRLSRVLVILMFLVFGGWLLALVVALGRML
jgi:membrane-associated protease RseP (regulator of RpoE activity)